DGTVLEAETFYREDSATPWQRGDLRLTRDWPEARLRAVAGDLVVPAVGFQGSRSVGGLAVARNFQLDPGTPYQPAGQQDFTLTDAATVEVLVNGRPARTYRLGPGPYSLRNFPGTLGANDVTIRIVDEFGRTQTISVPFFFDAQLLGEGVHEFAYAAGIASGIDRGVYRYDEGRLTASAWHRYGVSERLTLGLNLQGDRERRLLGAEALLATPYGTFGLEPALSDGGGIDPDYAARLTYRDFRSGEAVWQRRTLTAAATWRGPGFAPLGTVQPRNPVRLDLAARVSQPLLDWLSFGLGGRYQVSRDPEAGDTANAELLLRARLAPGASFDVSVERNRLADGGSETALFAGLRFALDGGRQTVGASYAARDRDAQLDWRYRGGEPVDRLEGGLQLGRDRFGRRIEGDAAFTGQRLVAQARSSYLDRLEEAGGRSRDRRTALSLGTALLYADGRFAVSRPVGDSFAIVEPHPRLEGRLIGVDPFGGAYLARSDALGAPVVPDLTGYRARSLLLDVPEAPANYDLGNDRPVVTPTYRSGTVVPIGTDATASLAGLLRDAEGKPLALRSGVLTPRAGGEGIAFFSNRQGRFRIEGVRPGAWVLTLHGDEGRPLPVEVPATAEGTLDLGILTPGEARP
ncbi:MAG TPA: fimbrial biogenesis outer membrane usher protein, partial [Alphaproteobacteria bacterium]|nr:fimbrial biogenesis outer membrane usher protein [Alphaproteobacteria bacterium]